MFVRIYMSQKYYFILRTTIDLAGISAVNTFFLSLAPLKSAGFTVLGCSKSLKSVMLLHASIRPVTVLPVNPSRLMSISVPCQDLCWPMIL